jgi:hypothetical protein
MRDVTNSLQRPSYAFWQTVRPSAVQSACIAQKSHEFHEILYLSTFRKFVEKIRVSLKSDKNNEYFTCGLTYIYENTSISLNSS